MKVTVSVIASRALLAAIAVVAMAGDAKSADRWRIGGTVCSQQSTNFGDTNISCYPGYWSNVEYRDDITVRASATCESVCSLNPISTARRMVIGVSGPCNNPVTYRFDAGSQDASLPYVYVRVTASSTVAYVNNAVTTKDCNGVPTDTGPGSFPEPC